MKKIKLLLVGMVILGCSFGQSITLEGHGYIDTLRLYNGNYTFWGYDTLVQIKRVDTVKIVMLISDTSYYRNPMAWWKFGYQVNKFIPEHWADFDRQVMVHWELVGYLDDKKKPLSKNIIVWQTKNR